MIYLQLKPEGTYGTRTSFSSKVYTLHIFNNISHIWNHALPYGTSETSGYIKCRYKEAKKQRYELQITQP